MLTTPAETSRSSLRRGPRELVVWREAAWVDWARCDVFLAAPAASDSAAFAAYVAVLDTERAGARELADLHRLLAT